MLLRWLTAIVGVPLFVGLCVWGPVPFTTGLFALAAVGLYEMLSGYRARGIRPNPILALLGLAPIAVGFGPAPSTPIDLPFGPDHVVTALVGLCLAAMLLEVVEAARTGELHAGCNLGYGALCGLYISLFAGLAWLRSFTHFLTGGVIWISQVNAGARIVLTLVISVWATDSFALFVGKVWGRHKLAPKLSPGKTVEGAIGGLVAGIAGGALAGYVLWASKTDGVTFGLIAGAIAGVFGQIGDLFESALKRELGIKDFGRIVPGHGGVLDRFDSLLFAAPFLCVFITWSTRIVWQAYFSQTPIVP